MLSIVLAPGDFVYGSSVTIQLTPSRPSTSVTIQIIDDSIRESEEYFTLSLRDISVDISSTVVVNPSTATVRIRDKDGITRHQLFTSECALSFFPEVTIGFSQTGYVVQESVGVASVSVRLLSGELDEEVSVRLTSSDGTTSAGTCITCIILSHMYVDYFKVLRISSTFVKVFAVSKWMICP